MCGRRVYNETGAGANEISPDVGPHPGPGKRGELVGPPPTSPKQRSSPRSLVYCIPGGGGMMDSDRSRDVPTVRTTTGEIDAGAVRIPLEAVPIPAIVYDARSLQILAANSAAATVFGFSFTELQAMSLHDIVPEDRLMLMRASIAASRGVPDFSGPFQYLSKRGVPIEVEIAVSETAVAR